MKEFLRSTWSDFRDSKLINKLITFLAVLLYIFVICISFIKVNYEVITPGTINYTAASVEIDSENTSGLIYTVGVYTHTRISLLQYWLAKHNNDFDIDEFDPNTDLGSAAQIKFGTISKEISINNAIINAYQEASKKDDSIYLSKEYLGVIVSAITPYAKTGLDYSDIIIAVNDESFNNIDEFKALIEKYSEDANDLMLTIVRDEVQKTVYCSYVNIPESSYLSLGIAVYDHYKLDSDKSNPKFSVVDEYTSIGSSGGGMLSLAIYNSLLPEDITKSKKIVGTGTIELDGTLGIIAGVKQKIITANKYNVDIFFVTATNYDVAKAEYDRIGATFELVKVTYFVDILNYLQGLETTNGE
ncbi:MAG: hypothetical protein PHO86_05085 [Bacilli bacterium]|nr:hypothetical protein [Bacilli bacterium]